MTTGRVSGIRHHFTVDVEEYFHAEIFQTATGGPQEWVAGDAHEPLEHRPGGEVGDVVLRQGWLDSMDRADGHDTGEERRCCRRRAAPSA